MLAVRWTDPRQEYRKGAKITALHKCCGSYWKIGSSMKCHFTEQYLAYIFSWKTLSLTPPVSTEVNGG